MHNIINNKSLVLGLMSGTSMDGLDISCARYYKKNNNWFYELICCETFEYSKEIKSDLLKTFIGEHDLDYMDVKFGSMLSHYIQVFIKKYNVKIDLVSSHGHTIFHNPKNGYTKQIGLGSIIAKNIGIPVVSNFRQQDIDFGGQGAPLVPVGDQLLFGHYDACVNLGGIANISFSYNGKRLAYDVSPCNMILNFLSKKVGKDFDQFGKMAQSGQTNLELLSQLNKINYYDTDPPKSLGKEYLDNFFIPILNQSKLSTNDMLSTFVEHVAIQMSKSFTSCNIVKSFFTGGGVFNQYLIARISYYTQVDIIIPDNDTVNFKEAIIFGFLGVLRVLNQNNCLAFSTGAYRDHCSGDVYML